MLVDIPHHFLEGVSRRHAPVRFVQIGANDGIRSDPVRDFILRYGWSGVLVEPVQHLFEQLRENYRGVAGLTFVNCAIAAESGDKPFYRLRRPEGSDMAWDRWYEQLSSLSRDVILEQRRRIPDLERCIVEERIHCVTFAELAAKHGLEAIDVLVTDTEGHDAAIIRSIDLARFAPEIIYYECNHHPTAVQADLVAYLERFGYINIPLLRDCIAVKRATLSLPDVKVLAGTIGGLARQEEAMRRIKYLIGPGGKFNITNDRGHLRIKRLPPDAAGVATRN